MKKVQSSRKEGCSLRTEPIRNHKQLCKECGGIGEYQGERCVRCRGIGYEPSVPNLPKGVG